MAAEEENWIELADLIDQQLAQLGWSQTDLVRESGVNATTIRAIQRTQRTSYRANTLRAVSRALGWGPMAIEVFLGGGEAPSVGERQPRDRWASKRDEELQVEAARKRQTGEEPAPSDLDALALASGVDPHSLSEAEKAALQVVFDGIRARRGTR